ncbi:hypothetical protein TNCV_1722611 [Trichonephila clavipes]|nr:hypothetical protein TNCV_1722611 [Trichonephila clavipes]
MASVEISVSGRMVVHIIRNGNLTTQRHNVNPRLVHTPEDETVLQIEKPPCSRFKLNEHVCDTREALQRDNYLRLLSRSLR